MNPAISAPMAFSATPPPFRKWFEDKRASVRLAPEFFAQLEDAAREEGLKLGPYCARLLRQIFRLEFLSAENIAWLGEIRAHLPGLGLLDVVNLVIGWARREVTAGRVVPGFLAGQAQKAESSAAARRARKQPSQAVVEQKA